MGTNEAHPAGSGDPRTALRAAVTAYLERAAERGDRAPVLEPGAAEQAARLAELLRDDEDDLISRLLLGWFHWMRYTALPDGQKEPDLSAAVGMLVPCLLAGVDLHQLPEPLRAQAFPMASTLHGLANASPDPRLIDATISLWGHLISSYPDGPYRAEMRANLGKALVTRFERTGAIADLDEAIGSLKEAATISGPGDLSRGEMLQSLGMALRARSQRTGSQADFDEAVSCLTESVASTPVDQPSRSGRLSNLGIVLRERFERTGALADLDEAIAVGRDAVATPADDPNPGGPLHNLASALHARFAQEQGRRPTSMRLSAC